MTAARSRWPGAIGVPVAAAPARAIRSAIVKPTPNTLVSSYGLAVIRSWAPEP